MALHEVVKGIKNAKSSGGGPHELGNSTMASAGNFTSPAGTYNGLERLSHSNSDFPMLLDLVQTTSNRWWNPASARTTSRKVLGVISRPPTLCMGISLPHKIAIANVRKCVLANLPAVLSPAYDWYAESRLTWQQKSSDIFITPSAPAEVFHFPLSQSLSHGLLFFHL